jgi:hypothetical protein
MVDEWQSFADLVPSEDTVFQRVGRFDAYRDQASGEMARHLAHAERVFYLVDGRLKVRRIVDLSLLGSFDAVRALASLHEAGVIAPLDTGSVQKSRRRARPKVLPRTNVRGWVATVVPLALLALVAFETQARNAAPPQPGVYPIPHSNLDLVRDDYATLRVIHALEAYRMSSGRWPERLAELSEHGILSPDELASDQGRPYYYVGRAEGAVLLAPER